MLPHNLERLLHPATSGDDVFDHQKLFARLDDKATAKDEFVIVFLCKNVRQTELSRNFMTNNQTAQSGRNHPGRTGFTRFLSQLPANLRRDLRVLKEKRALEELATVQAGTQQEMAL